MPDSRAYEIVKRPLLTEKNMHRAETRGEYTFEVSPRSNKVEIRRAIEDIYNVKVVRVNTTTKKGLPRRFGWNWSRLPDRKKAIVKLAKGYKIELL